MISTNFLPLTPKPAKYTEEKKPSCAGSVDWLRSKPEDIPVFVFVSLIPAIPFSMGSNITTRSSAIIPTSTRKEQRSMTKSTPEQVTNLLYTKMSNDHLDTMT